MADEYDETVVEDHDEEKHTEDDDEEEDIEQEQKSTKKGKGGSMDKEVRVKQMVDLPLARVKRIMKSDSDVKLISQEAVVLVTKAAELLIEHLAEESFKRTQADNRKTMQYKDLAVAVKENECFDFLEDIIPERKNVNTLFTKKH